MDNKKLLKQILKIDNKAEKEHKHDEYITADDFPNGGYITVHITSDQWELSDENLYTVEIEHNLNTTDIISEAVSVNGELLIIGYENINENSITLISDDAIEMHVSILHRAQAHTTIGYNPIDDNEINSFQTWSSEKISKALGQGGNIDTSDLVTKEELDKIMNNVVMFETISDNNLKIDNANSTRSNEPNFNMIEELNKEKAMRLNLEKRVAELESLIKNIL